MKRFIILITALLGLALLPAEAAQFKAMSFLPDHYSTPITLYAPAAGTTFTYGNFYTNIIVSNKASLSTFYPLATNTSMGITNSIITNAGPLYPDWTYPIITWSDVNGNVPTGAVSLVYAAGDTNVTNTVTFVFARSVGGTYYDTSTTWSVAVTPSTSTACTITNMPSFLLTGNGTIRLQSVTTAANNAAGTLKLYRIQAGGWVP
jgi:hypothetical protein